MQVAQVVMVLPIMVLLPNPEPAEQVAVAVDDLKIQEPVAVV